jgi:ribonuclease HI
MNYLYFDGGSRGNPGLSGSGWYIKFNDGTHREGSYFVGHTNTNNEAEYWGLIKGLEEIQNLDGPWTIFGDSKLVIQQVNEIWRVKAVNLKPLYSNVKKLINDSPNRDKMTFKHIRRELNTLADKQANKAMDEMS